MNACVYVSVDNPQIIQASNPVQRVAVEGHLATCGKCQVFLLKSLPLSSLVSSSPWACPRSLAASAEASMPSIIRPCSPFVRRVCFLLILSLLAFMTCPVCKGNIVYCFSMSTTLLVVHNWSQSFPMHMWSSHCDSCMKFCVFLSYVDASLLYSFLWCSEHPYLLFFFC